MNEASGINLQRLPPDIDAYYGTMFEEAASLYGG